MRKRPNMFSTYTTSYVFLGCSNDLVQTGTEILNAIQRQLMQFEREKSYCGPGSGGLLSKEPKKQVQTKGAVTRRKTKKQVAC